MIIKGTDVVLETIGQGDIEMLRKWRNDDQVKKHLVSIKHISVEDQQKWFQSLDPQTSIYFLFKINDIPTGLVYANHINTKDLSFEGSIFVGDKQYFDTYYPIKAILILSFYFFEKLKFETSYSTVNENNKAALDMDRRFGYKQISKNDDFIKSSCTREDYLKNTRPFKEFFFSNGTPEIIEQEWDSRFTFK